MIHRPFLDSALAAAFAAFPETHRPRLLMLRDLVWSSAEKALGPDALVESLKWGEPAYRPRQDRIGTTVRLGISRITPAACAIFVHCKTDLLARFRDLYGDLFGFEGERALLLPPDAPVPETALDHCIALALTYHRRHSQAGKS